MTPEGLARLFHAHYEELAPMFGYSTRDESKGAWGNVPDANRRLMIATAAAVIESMPSEVRYKMADGTLVGCEFTYVGELEFFDDADEPVELIRETIVLVQSERYTHVSQSAQSYLDCLAEAEAMDAEGE